MMGMLVLYFFIRSTDLCDERWCCVQLSRRENVARHPSCGHAKRVISVCIRLWRRAWPLVLKSFWHSGSGQRYRIFLPLCIDGSSLVTVKSFVIPLGLVITEESDVALILLLWDSEVWGLDLQEASYRLFFWFNITSCILLGLGSIVGSPCHKILCASLGSEVDEVSHFLFGEIEGNVGLEWDFEILLFPSLGVWISLVNAICACLSEWQCGILDIIEVLPRCCVKEPPCATTGLSWSPCISVTSTFFWMVPRCCQCLIESICPSTAVSDECWGSTGGNESSLAPTWIERV